MPLVKLKLYNYSDYCSLHLLKSPFLSDFSTIFIFYFFYFRFVLAHESKIRNIAEYNQQQNNFLINFSVTFVIK